MNERAEALIRLLNLHPHPEGGFYRRIHQSENRVFRSQDGIDRRALTTIYYLLPEGSISRWHAVEADEVWHFYEGAPLELLSFDARGSSLSMHQLGPLESGCSPVFVVPAGWWQAARSLGAYTLVGCTVGPGFEFEDFTLLADLPEAERPPQPKLPNFSSYL